MRANGVKFSNLAVCQLLLYLCCPALHQGWFCSWQSLYCLLWYMVWGIHLFSYCAYRCEIFMKFWLTRFQFLICSKDHVTFMNNTMPHPKMYYIGVCLGIVYIYYMNVCGYQIWYFNFWPSQYYPQGSFSNYAAWFVKKCHYQAIFIKLNYRLSAWSIIFHYFSILIFSFLYDGNNSITTY